MAKFLGEARAVLSEVSDGLDIAAGIWRRHGNRGYEILSAVKANPEDGEAVFDGLDICRAEVNHVLHHESIQRPEDLLRRRLPITMTRGLREIENNEFLQGKLAQLA
jgi:glycerol-3-phosphate dehydrogenase